MSCVGAAGSSSGCPCTPAARDGIWRAIARASATAHTAHTAAAASAGERLPVSAPASLRMCAPGLACLSPTTPVWPGVVAVRGLQPAAGHMHVGAERHARGGSGAARGRG